MLKKNPIIILLCLTITTALLITGCSQGSIMSPTSEPGYEAQADSLFEEAELDYAVPSSEPNILVNQLGYLSGSNKIAIFRGEDLPESFTVVNMETKEVVFTGKVEDRGYNTYIEEYNSYGVFTEINEPGEYYIEAPVVGRSYSFLVGDDIYNGVFADACKQYYYNRCGMTLTEGYAGEYARSACHIQNVALRENPLVSLDVSGGWHQEEYGSKDVERACSVVNSMLLALELSGTAFADNTHIPESGNQIPDVLDEIRYELDWLLKMQDSTSGGVYAGVTIQPQTGSPEGTAVIEDISVKATIAFCGSLAKFSYLYQSYDKDFANLCIKAANRAWRYLERHPLEEDAGLHFLAAAEMYRAVGYQSYHQIIINYLKKNIVNITDRKESVVIGCVTYLSTKRSVNRQYCGGIMKALMSNAEDIAAKARQSQYLTAGNKKQDNNQQLLEEMFYLSIMNQIINNHEYETVIENHFHYLCGRNSLEISYVDGVGVKSYEDHDIEQGIFNQIDMNTKFIFMLSEIISSNAEE